MKNRIAMIFYWAMFPWAFLWAYHHGHDLPGAGFCLVAAFVSIAAYLALFSVSQAIRK